MLVFQSYIRHADRTTVDHSLFPRNHNVVLSFLPSECCRSYAASTHGFAQQGASDSSTVLDIVKESAVVFPPLKSRLGAIDAFRKHYEVRPHRI